MSKSKPWERPVAGRARPASRERRRVLIVCEDSKSSRYYFESFPVDRQRIEISVVGAGRNTGSLVEDAAKRKEQAAKQRQRYADVWCVFDRDSFPAENYARAFQLAAKNKIKIAWANEAFELWYLLHYCYLNTGVSRHDYQQKLREHGLDYDKADKTVYEKVKPLQRTAIKHAERLQRHWADCGKSSPQKENPSTSVHKLVEFLNELAGLGPKKRKKK